MNWLHIIITALGSTTFITLVQFFVKRYDKNRRKDNNKNKNKKKDSNAQIIIKNLTINIVVDDNKKGKKK